MSEKNFKLVELVIDEENESLSIDAISLVTEPAIQVDFVYFNKQKKSNLHLAKIDEEKRLLVSPALIPNKQIFRFDQETGQEYYVFFSKSTVKQASENYLKHQNNNNATIQHESKVAGVHTVESWIVQDTDIDKSRLYGFNVPEGTWMVSMKIENDDVWNGIKEGVLKGLSIEGYFIDRMQKMSQKAPENKDMLPTFDNKEDALEFSKSIGCEGCETVVFGGQEFFLPCTNEEILEMALEVVKEMDSEKATK